MESATKPQFTVKATDRGVFLVKMSTNSFVDWEQWILLRSDAHWDNPKCNRKLELKHLRQAVERRAGIIDAGDLFCAMQGKYDNRSDKSSVRPEHQNGRYLDSLVETAAEYYAPFAHNFIVLGKGNHETAIIKRHETDLTVRLAERLNALTGSNILVGGYTGWIRFAISYHGRRHAKLLWYTHGYAGGGPVTKDTIQFNRQVGYIENADFMMSGHTHDSWQMDNPKYRVSTSGKLRRRVVVGIKCPTYKDEYGAGEGGFAVEKGHPPKPLGAWWLKFTGTNSGNRMEVHCDIIKAS
jgi:hypothetical protein